MKPENEQKLIEAVEELNKTMKKIQIDVFLIYVLVAVILASVSLVTFF